MKGRRTEILLFDIKGEEKKRRWQTPLFSISLWNLVDIDSHMMRSQPGVPVMTHLFSNSLSLFCNWSSIKNIVLITGLISKQLLGLFPFFLPEWKLNIGRKRIFSISAIIRRWFDSEILAGTVGSSRHPRRTRVEQSRALGIENKFEKREKNRRAVRQQLSEMASRLSPVFCQICFPLHMDRHSTKWLAPTPHSTGIHFIRPHVREFPSVSLSPQLGNM